MGTSMLSYHILVARVLSYPPYALLVSTWCNEFASNSWGYDIMIKEAFLTKSTKVRNAFTIQINN